MDINKLENHVEALRTATHIGIFSVNSQDQIHVDNVLFEDLLPQAGGKYTVQHIESVKYPIQVSFVINHKTYFAIYSESEFKSKFGGNVDELTTAN